eukprot:TRINITY_DN37137_c0_g1_i1.p1 TRINITY_DN37137_c0_g1~~TRINITY_DN37137_c0_g1_i1.p1  ORF type:complete len:145 (+),score=25.29 TRINITY_DN37137_c0_g1_i1:56-436(+)
MEEATIAVLVICCLVLLLGIIGMLLKFSVLCAAKDEGSLESIYSRRSTKPLVEEVKNFDQASAPDQLNIIPEDLEELICDQDGSRISLSAFRQVSCPDFAIEHDITDIKKYITSGTLISGMNSTTK